MALRIGLGGGTAVDALAENEFKPWREKMCCVPKIDGECVARMDAVASGDSLRRDNAGPA